jgi:hypothetical protein
MATKRVPLDNSAPHIPIEHLPWFIQIMMLFAVTALAGIVYGFWQISQAEPARPALPEVQVPEQVP